MISHDSQGAYMSGTIDPHGLVQRRGSRMGLGPKYRRAAPGQASDVLSAVDVLKFPVVPLTGPGGVFGAVEEEASDATRLLCAAAHLRPRPQWSGRAARRNATDRMLPKQIREARKARREQAEQARAAAQQAALEAAEVDPSPKEKFVPLGLDYARWVRTRVLTGPRPVPSHGFDLGAVAASCARASQLGRQRSVLIWLSLIVGALWGWAIDPRWAPAVAVIGVWLSFYRDRVRAQRLLRVSMDAGEVGWGQPRELTGRSEREVGRIRALEGQPVIPYLTEPRSGRVQYHFLGAGKVWFESSVGVDVMPAVNPGDDVSSDVAAGLLPSVERLLGGRDRDGSVRPFNPDDVIDHLEQQLQRPVKPDRDFHPDSRQEVFGVATINAQRWPGVSAEQWDALVTLAHHGVHAPGAHKASKVARRFLDARMVSWDGEVVASVFIGVAYENHFLRVILRPQVLNPVHPAITAARSQAQRTGGAFHRQALGFAALDTVAALRQAFGGSPTGRTPDMDAGAAAVSIREIYSARFMDDMLQYDDARRYILMIQRRALSAVYGFLEAHNVDTTAFRAQTTVILNNSGVMNTGEMSNVQNQPGAINSNQM
jgi:hypothetical protein